MTGQEQSQTAVAVWSARVLSNPDVLEIAERVAGPPPAGLPELRNRLSSEALSKPLSRIEIGEPVRDDFSMSLADTAREIDRKPQRVGQLADAGQLADYQPGGRGTRRLISVSSVEEYLDRREAN